MSFLSLQLIIVKTSTLTRVVAASGTLRSSNGHTATHYIRMRTYASTAHGWNYATDVEAALYGRAEGC